MKKNNVKAEAMIRGSAEYPEIKGIARFSEVRNGVLVAISLNGLPPAENKCGQRIFAAHIHEGGSCSGNSEDPFKDSGSHFNPKNCPHPFHAGDMPPLFAVGRTAAVSFITNRFTIPEIIGRTIIIHSGEDDFHTQPSGNSGEKIACGVIKVKA